MLHFPVSAILCIWLRYPRLIAYFGVLLAIKETTGCQTAELWLLDLSKFSSVIAFANKFEVEGVKLDILVANAAVGKTVYETTSDGWEET